MAVDEDLELGEALFAVTCKPGDFIEEDDPLLALRQSPQCVEGGVPALEGETAGTHRAA